MRDRPNLGWSLPIRSFTPGTPYRGQFASSRPYVVAPQAVPSGHSDFIVTCFHIQPANTSVLQAMQ